MSSPSSLPAASYLCSAAWRCWFPRSDGGKAGPGDGETAAFLGLTTEYFHPFHQLLTSEESLCIESFDMAWKTISSLSSTQLTFWPNLKAFVHFVFNNEILTVAAKVKGQAYFRIKEVTLFSLRFGQSVDGGRRGVFVTMH